MDVDYASICSSAAKLVRQLKQSSYVRITGEGTDLIAHVDQLLMKASTGVLRRLGDKGNLPGAEVYFVPVHLGNTNGHYTVPAGWGGPFPLEYKARFEVGQGRIVRIIGEDSAAQAYIDAKVNPLVFGGQDWDVVAEVGRGLNTAITTAYVQEHGWSPLAAEKIFFSSHIANGNSKSFGGKNDVRVHHDWVIPDTQVEYQFSPAA